MRNLTSVQAMYINRKRSLRSLSSQIDSLAEHLESEKDEILLDSLIDEYNELFSQLEVIEFILEDDVPEVDINE